LINPVGAIIKRVVMVSQSGEKRLNRLELFDKNNNLVLKVGKDQGNVRKEFVLEDGERLIGFKSKLESTMNAYH
jgi:hypothetical protein